MLRYLRVAHIVAQIPPTAKTVAKMPNTVLGTSTDTVSKLRLHPLLQWLRKSLLTFCHWSIFITALILRNWGEGGKWLCHVVNFTGCSFHFLIKTNSFRWMVRKSSRWLASYTAWSHFPLACSCPNHLRGSYATGAIYLSLHKNGRRGGWIRGGRIAWKSRTNRMG